MKEYDHEYGWTVLINGREVARLHYEGFDNTKLGFRVSLVGISPDSWMNVCDRGTGKDDLRFRNHVTGEEVTPRDFTIIYVDAEHVNLYDQRFSWRRLLRLALFGWWGR